MFPDELIEVLRNAKKIAILTGAGVSAESGIPTFRDALTGLWAKYNPQELATTAAFKRDPKLVWDFYEMRREIVRDAKPNPGHYALAALQRHVPKLTLVTQNIDSLHQQAGSQEVIELHGNLSRVKCFEHHHIVEKAHLPLIAMEKMTPAIEVNLHETEFSSHMDYVLRGPSGKRLPALVEAVWGENIAT